MISRTAFKTIVLTALLLLAGATATATGDLIIVVKNEDSTAINNADIVVEKGTFQEQETTNNKGKAFFDDLEEGTYTANITHSDYRTRQIDVAIQSNTEITSQVILEAKDSFGGLDIHVENPSGNSLSDAGVSIVQQDGSYTDDKQTDNSGNAFFTNIPPGQYDLYVNHDSYDSHHTTVDIEADKKLDRNIIMRENQPETTERDLEITGVIVPSKALKGAEIPISVKITNRGNQQETSIETTIDAFGQKNVSQKIDINAGSSKWVVLTALVPMDASGPNTIHVETQNSFDRDVVQTTVSVSELRGYLDTNTRKIGLGDTVYISGRITNSNMNGVASTSANIYAGGSFLTGVTTDQNGNFNTYYTPDTTGSHRITLKNSNLQTSTTIHVSQKVDVTGIETADPITSTNDLTACGQITVFSEQNLQLQLFMDDEKIGSKNAFISEQGNVCFNLPAETENGEHTLRLEASAGQQKDTYTKKTAVEITQPRNTSNQTTEAPSFSTAITQDENGSRILRITVTNPHKENRTLTLRITGLPHQTGTKNMSLVVRAESSTTTDIHIPGNNTNNTAQQAIAGVELLQGEQTLGSENVALYEQEQPSLLTRAKSFADRQKYLLILLAGIILIYLIKNEALGLFKPDPLEPRRR